MSSESRSNRDWLVHAAALVVVLGALKLATPLVVPILLAAFLAIVTGPLMFWLIRKGVQRYVAVGLALSADIAFFGLMAAFTARGLNALVSAMPRYQERVSVLRVEASNWLTVQGLPDLGHLLPRAIREQDTGPLFASALTEVAHALSSLVLVLFIVAFLLVEMLGIEDKLRLIFKHPEIGIEQFRRAAAHVQRYIVVKTGANLFTGLLVWLWLAAFRVDFALLWGVFAAMLGYIPTVGSVMVGVPVVAVTLLQYGFGTTLVVGTGYILINAAIAALLEPRVFGHALGLSPLVVFVSMVCWGWLWGPVGAVLSVPLTVVVKIVLAYVEGYEWLARMLGPVSATSVGVGTPSIPPGVLSLPPGVVSAAAGISLGNHPERSSSASLAPVVLPSAPAMPAIISGVGPIVPGAPALIGHGSPEDELE
ncbi:MAG: AI-2E family transporter [Myxococcales bacterium]